MAKHSGELKVGYGPSKFLNPPNTNFSLRDQLSNRLNISGNFPRIKLSKFPVKQEMYFASPRRF